MEFVKAMQTRNKMCKTLQKKNPSNYCSACPLSSFNNSFKEPCTEIINNNPELAESILEQWDKEHPAIRNADKLREIFPYADSQIMRICPHWLGCKAPFVDGCDAGPCSACREEFWKSEYVEVKEND